MRTRLRDLTGIQVAPNKSGDMPYIPTLGDPARMSTDGKRFQMPDFNSHVDDDHNMKIIRTAAKAVMQEILVSRILKIYQNTHFQVRITLPR